jgi:hypothetical protein
MGSNTANFKRHRNQIFIETGSYLGDGIQQALEAGFSEIISIELSDKYYEHTKKRFEFNPRIEIVKGDSFKVLPKLLAEINKRITFWLDGHYSCDDTALGEHWSPLIQELDVIKSHKIKNHTIMIDDMRCWELPNKVHGFFKEDIYRKLREINPEYKFELLSGHVEDDILVAYIDLETYLNY